MTGTVERARNRWREILPELGIDTRFLTNKHGPCPLCGGKDRFRFDDRNGSGSYICGQCGAGVGLILVRKLKGWDHATACRQVDEIIGRDDKEKPQKKRAAIDQAKEKARRLARIERTLAEAHDERIVAAFLRSRRLTVTSIELHGHPHCEYFDEARLIGRFPAIIAPIRAADGSLVSAAVLYSASAPSRRKFMQKVDTINGAAVRLYEPENGHLAIAEGIATAMAARQLFGTPTWSVLSAHGMKSWSSPKGITRVTVYADNDENYTGQLAAYYLAHRLRLTGIKTEVMVPQAIGTDYADQLPA